MHRSTSVSLAATLALAVLAAPLAHAQTGTSDAAKAPAATTAKTASTHHATHMAKKPMPKVDLNSASKEDLERLPGVGEATADKIIAARPLKTKSELVSKGIVTRAEYAKLASHVVARQAAK